MKKTKAVLLLSSGIDSPVAGHIAKKQGIELHAVSFYQNKIQTKKVKKLAEKIGAKSLHMMKHKNFMDEISKKCAPEYICILCKRFMYRVASMFAEKNDIKYIIDGSNLGQVASQTLSNLVITSKAVDKEILRPLLGKEKTETMEIARKIGTLDISNETEESCKYVPKKPSTKSTQYAIEKQEKKLDIDSLCETTLESSEDIKL
ncbi:MAG: 7-cyano-7-deazaguanine synthase [Candidatus Woesearchaeota archaeon]